MQRPLIVAALASLLALTAAAAVAGDHRSERHEQRNHEQRHERDRDHDDRHRQHPHRDRYATHHYSEPRKHWDDRRRVEQRHWDDRPRYRVGHYHAPHGYRPYHWRRGDRLPAAYCAPRYIVHDYHVYRLPRPPRGHHYVRVDGDVVLAAIASGIVSQVVFGLFY
jgi:Ni/Co efflux regulator RcnB